VLYLAEVQKKSRVIGSSKVEFKLLACQRAENTWSAVGEESIPAPDDVNYNSGTLVMVDLSSNRQVQRHSEAGRQLVSILQNFSRLQEKFKTQEEEIEQWKQSLTYQSQELNRREMEMEARQEQLQQMEEDFERLEQQRQEIDVAQEQVNRLQEEFTRKTQELEGAWAHLDGEKRRFEEQQDQIPHAVGLDDSQAQHIQDLLHRISNTISPTDSLREQINTSFEIVSQQQEALNHHWQNLEDHQSSAQQMQGEVDEQAQELQNRWHQWHEDQEILEHTQAELSRQKSALEAKQDAIRALSSHVQQQTDLYEQARYLAETSGTGPVAKVDVNALEHMQLETLQTTVTELQQELEKNSRFVSSQEEELNLQQEEIEKLRAQIQQASEYDRLSLETQLADEQESYRMLNETLVGQRRNLQEREAVLKQHKIILARRQGLPLDEGQQSDINIEPLLRQIDSIRQHQSQELQKLEEQVQQMQGSVVETEEHVSQKTTAQESVLAELKQFEQEWKSKSAALAELLGKVNAYRDVLQPIQDNLNGLKEKLEAIASLIAQFQESGDYQLQAIHEMQQQVQQLTDNPSPELAAS
jgi:chromosome segregation ATPase